MLRDLRRSDWLLVPAFAAMIGFWGLALTGSFPAIPSMQQTQQHTVQPAPHKQGWQVIDKLVAFVVTLKADSWIAAFTGFTTLIFLGQLMAMWRENRHFRVTERAYVKMSHTSPPGLDWAESGSNWFLVDVVVKNFGRTPARVIGVMLTYRVIPNGQTMPDTPVYTGDDDWRDHAAAFLVTNDDFHQQGQFELSSTDKDAVVKQRATLFFYGYVDYIDQFGQRHRAGYGRQYMHGLPQNNLVFPESGRLNYDRKHRRGEDWDKS